jgi:hypothetical protein
MTGCLLKKVKQESSEFVALLWLKNKVAVEQKKKTEIQFICWFTTPFAKKLFEKLHCAPDLPLIIYLSPLMSYKILNHFEPS